MMTPQEVASHSFAKATLGGYNLAMVDEFLDALTEDYTALYDENAILKGHLKKLADRVKEYQDAEASMGRTMLAAQKTANDLLEEAKKKQADMLVEAEREAQALKDELIKQIDAEEYRLKKAQESTAAYVRKLAQAHDEELAFLSRLGELVPPEVTAAVQDDPSADIQAALDAQVRQEEEEAASRQEAESRAADAGPDDGVSPMPETVPVTQEQEEFELDPDATRRYSDLQFGKDYQIQ